MPPAKCPIRIFTLAFAIAAGASSTFLSSVTLANTSSRDGLDRAPQKRPGSLSNALPPELKIHLSSSKEKAILDFGRLLLAAEGGNSSGGGSFVRTGPNSRLILLDFLKLGEEVRVRGPLPAAGRINVDRESLWRGFTPVKMQEQPALRFALARVARWQFKSPFTVKILADALRSIEWRYSPYRLKAHEKAMIPAAFKAKYPSAAIVPAVLYTKYFGAWISASLWNEDLDITNQAGLLIHEALRYIEDRFGLKIGEDKLQTLTANLVLSEPSETSFDPDKTVFNRPTGGRSLAYRSLAEAIAGTDRALQAAMDRLLKRLSQAQAEVPGQVLSAEKFKAAVCAGLTRAPEDPFSVRADACSGRDPDFDTRTLKLLVQFRAFALAFQNSKPDPRLEPSQEAEIARLIASYDLLKRELNERQLLALLRESIVQQKREIGKHEAPAGEDLKLMEAINGLTSFLPHDSVLEKAHEILVQRQDLWSRQLEVNRWYNGLRLKALTFGLNQATTQIRTLTLSGSAAAAGISNEKLTAMIFQLAEAAESGKQASGLISLLENQDEKTIEVLIPYLAAASETLIRMRSYERYLDLSSPEAPR